MLQSDRVYSALNATETTETKVGSITIPPVGVRRIVGISAQLMQPTATAGEQISGYVRLAFKTVSGLFKFSAQAIYGPAGTLAASQHGYVPAIIPVDIPVPANEVVDCYMAADVVLTGTGTGAVSLLME